MLYEGRKMKSTRLKVELIINDLLELLIALDKGNQVAVMYSGQLIKAIEYNELERDLLKLIIKENIKALNKEITQMNDEIV